MESIVEVKDEYVKPLLETIKEAKEELSKINGDMPAKKVLTLGAFYNNQIALAEQSILKIEEIVKRTVAIKDKEFLDELRAIKEIIDDNMEDNWHVVELINKYNQTQ